MTMPSNPAPAPTAQRIDALISDLECAQDHLTGAVLTDEAQDVIDSCFRDRDAAREALRAALASAEPNSASEPLCWRCKTRPGVVHDGTTHECIECAGDTMRRTRETLQQIDDVAREGLPSWPRMIDRVEFVRACIAEHRLRAAEGSIPCGVCGGSGKPASGKPCICDGVGTQDAELVGLRKLLFDTQEQYEHEVADAARWRKLIGCARVRVIGSARLGQPDAHIGVEFWGKYPGVTPEDSTGSVADLTEYVDGLQ